MCRFQLRTPDEEDGGVPVPIRTPDEEDGITQSQIDYIKDKFDILENYIYNNNFTDIDMETFIKYFLIGEY